MKKKYEFRSNLTTVIKAVIVIILISLHRSVSMNTKMIAFIAYLIEMLFINNYMISLKLIYNIIIIIILAILIWKEVFTDVLMGVYIVIIVICIIIITIWDISYNHDEYLWLYKQKMCSRKRTCLFCNIHKMCYNIYWERRQILNKII